MMGAHAFFPILDVFIPSTTEAIIMFRVWPLKFLAISPRTFESFERALTRSDRMLPTSLVVPSSDAFAISITVGTNLVASDPQ